MAQGQASGADIITAVTRVDGRAPLAGQRLEHRQPGAVRRRDGQVHLSHTVVCSPAATRLRAMAEPMMPVPSTATASSVIDFSHRVTSVTVPSARLVPGRQYRGSRLTW